MTLSLVTRLRRLPEDERRAILERCSARELAALRWSWRRFWARPDVREPGAPHLGRGQLPPPGAWTWWANIGGRGSGKTRTCAEWVTEMAMEQGRGFVIHLVAQTPEDGRDAMIEGVSGLATVAPPWAGFDFKSSKEGGEITWRSGARGRIFGANVPRKGRGPACCAMWLDDPAAFSDKGLETFKMLLYGFRERMPDGSDPRGVISSTPIDTDLLDEILANEDGSHGTTTVYSYSISDDNRANLSEKWFTETLAKMAGTELEQQERYGKRIVSGSGKVFAGIELSAPPIRVAALPPDVAQIAIWVDPATSSAVHSCEVGIVVVALDARGHLYGVEDRSGVLGADAWPGVVVDAVERWAPIAPIRAGVETNKGGNMGRELIASAEKIRHYEGGLRNVPPLEIRTVHAQQSKAQRASPLVRLFRSGYLHLLPGLAALERQLRELDDTEGPKRDRADAFVHAVLDLAEHAAPAPAPVCPHCQVAHCFQCHTVPCRCVPLYWDGGFSRAPSPAMIGLSDGESPWGRASVTTMPNYPTIAPFMGAIPWARTSRG